MLACTNLHHAKPSLKWLITRYLNHDLMEERLFPASFHLNQCIKTARETVVIAKTLYRLPVESCEQDWTDLDQLWACSMTPALALSSPVLWGGYEGFGLEVCAPPL